MLIRHENYLEKGMNITFSELKEKHRHLVGARQKLRQQLQNCAAALQREYTESLALPALNWFNSEDKQKPYVEVGKWKEPGKFVVAHLHSLPLDEHYRLNFVIATTLDDSPATGGARHGVSVSLFYEGAFLYAIVGDDGDTAPVMASLHPGGFSEVCSLIKTVISLTIAKSMPSAILP